MHNKQPEATSSLAKFIGKWILICGAITASIGIVPSVYYVFSWKAKVDDAIQRAPVVEAKVDKVSSDVSEIKGYTKAIYDVIKPEINMQNKIVSK